MTRVGAAEEDGAIAGIENENESRRLRLRSRRTERVEDDARRLGDT